MPEPTLTLLTQESPPLEDIWVALDIETTGLSPEKDEIIEIGAVKFRGREVLETFQSFVNPRRRLTDFIRHYTGISQKDVDSAPTFAHTAQSLSPFIGSTPVVGHNVNFDLSFLASKGFRLSSPVCDTWDMAYVFLPESKEYSLSKISASLGIEHPRPHRALDDADITRELFLKLGEIAGNLDVYTLAAMERIAAKSPWIMAYLLKRLELSKISASSARVSPESGEMKQSSLSSDITGLNIQGIRSRLQRSRSLRARERTQTVDPVWVTSLLKNEGPLAAAIPDFEERPQQLAMGQAVSEAINDGKRLIVEAGTGVGKSLAYLLPSALYALKNNKRVVVSTNTINLQEQLLTKDIPAMVEALAGVDDIPIEQFKFTQLKGRANYLCLKRFSHLQSSETFSVDEARLLSKTLVWSRDTETGDRSELNLGNRRSTAPWDRLSAQGAQDCMGVKGTCFLKAARDRAAASHLVIVNHALLISDIVSEGTLIPDHDILIVDEAHHLESEATRHLGFELAQGRLNDHLQILVGDHGLLKRASLSLRGSSAGESRRAAFEEVASRVFTQTPKLRDATTELFADIGKMLEFQATTITASRDMRITSATRGQPGWSQLEIKWENVDLLLAEILKEIQALSTALEGLEHASLLGYEELVPEVLNLLQVTTDLRKQLTEFIPQPEPDQIYWVSRFDRSGDLVLHGAPLHVGEQLKEQLFQRKESVILTSATLSTGGTFDHVTERIGFSENDELLLGSPFDYAKAALICVPKDISEPNFSDYHTEMERAVLDSTVASDGATMALFTSHASLQAVAGSIRSKLQSKGFDVLAQGIDGQPHQILRRFLENPKSVLLGTASFWEGVDLPGESLRVILVARLPFSVPTEPVFEARSELYEDSFSAYALPEAILRLRQGFGRLIRTKTDRGVVVILDRRIVSRGYGKAFLTSLPPVDVSICMLSELGDKVQEWLNRE